MMLLNKNNILKLYIVSHFGTEICIICFITSLPHFSSLPNFTSPHFSAPLLLTSLPHFSSLPCQTSPHFLASLLLTSLPHFFSLPCHTSSATLPFYHTLCLFLLPYCPCLSSVPSLLLPHFPYLPSLPHFMLSYARPSLSCQRELIF